VIPRRYFVGVGPGWPTRIALVLGGLLVAALIALALIVIGGVHTQRDGDISDTVSTTTPADSCWPFCLPDGRPVPTESNLYTPP
jgi:hypothetical protein